MTMIVSVTMVVVEAGDGHRVACDEPRCGFVHPIEPTSPGLTRMRKVDKSEES